VLVIGDSNVFNSGRAIDLELREADFEPVIHGYPGFGLKDFDSYWNEKVQELLRADPAVVVVALGTNDVELPRHTREIPVRIDQMMGLIGDRPAAWVTVAKLRPGGNPPTAGETVNLHLLAADAKYSNLTLIDWGKTIEEDPSVLHADRLHWSRKGTRLYAKAIREVVVDLYELCVEAADPACV
jgi:lysophospholipase L1-like esterase